MQRFDRILVPVDASALADRALDAALEVASRFGSEVTVLWVRQDAADLDQSVADAELREVEDEVRSVDAQIARRLALMPADRRLPASRVRAEVRAGAPADAIVAAAGETMADLVVMGTHGRSGLFERITGSTTEQVALRVSASVLSIKPEGYPFLRD